MIIALIVTVLAAGFTAGLLGMGFQMVGMAVVPNFLPYKTSVVLLLMLSCIFSIGIVYRLRSSIDWKIILYPVTFALAGRFLGFYILMRTDEKLLTIVLGIILILLSVYFFLFSERNFVVEGKLAGVITGLISGISGGITNIGGPPLVIYFLNITSSKEQYLATLNSIYFITNLFSLFLHIRAGNISQQTLGYSAILVVPLIVGLKLGLSAMQRVDGTVFKRLIYSFMIVIGLKMVLMS